jgi:hypothetical protein
MQRPLRDLCAIALMAFPIPTGLVVGGLLFFSTAAQSSAALRTGPHRIILYSVAEREQFINNADDAARGAENNPSGISGDIPSLRAPANRSPTPGDEVLFSFNVYSSANLKTRSGTAIFTCQYNFDTDALCDVAFKLNGGILIAEGAFNFNAMRFTLVITGGYGRYNDAVGAVEETPNPNHAQELSFRLD